MIMSPSDEIQSLIDNILNSRDFKDSPVYSNLLTYLVQSAESAQVPKEITIAIEVFGRDTDFNSNKDSTVRYHIHMLRKKLDGYYKNEGKRDKIRLVIPKGHYEIKFVPVKDRGNRSERWFTIFLKRWQLVFLIILLFSNFYWILRLGRTDQTSEWQNSADPGDKIWGSFFNNELPLSIILGDVFLLDEYCDEYKRYRQVQDWEIYSESDLNDFLIHYPNAKLRKSEITGIPFGGVQNLMDIMPVIYPFEKQVTLRLSSTLFLEDIRNQNVIYIGEFSNLRILDKMISKTPIRYQYRPDERLFIVNEQGDTVQTFIRIEAPYEQKNKYNVDYSLLVKIPGFTHENLMFIVGFGYGGRLERTKLLGDLQLRSAFIDEIHRVNQTVPEYFIAVFEVRSIERTGFSDELKYFLEISSNFFTE